ncbi:hypothetical protein ACSQ67_000873 [Phaseolus vulgaris]
MTFPKPRTSRTPATNHRANHRTNHSREQGVLDPVRGDDHRTIKGHRATPLLSLSNPDTTVLPKGTITTAPTTNCRAWVSILILNVEPGRDQPRHRYGHY